MTLSRKNSVPSIGSRGKYAPNDHSDRGVEQSRKLEFEIPSLTLRDRNFNTLLDSSETFGERGANPARDGSAISSHTMPRHIHRHRLLHSDARASAKKKIRILKFGGTSVGDAQSIERVVEIVRASSRETTSVVVVSAMNGVTNKLVEAAAESAAGNCERASLIFKELRKRHDSAASELIHSAGERNRISDEIRELIQEGERLCHGAARTRRLAPRVRDTILSTGERLSVLLVAGALAERGVPSEAVNATELLVTDDNHGSAEPLMDPTRQRCGTQLRPLMRQGIVPVITGFIGATLEGAITTLGRGSSDYSATILGAALDANEVVIWTDVDGVLTADPHMVPDARTIPELSYHEAAEFATFGAKVMHPKIFRPLKRAGIPIWVRNTFAPEQCGTKITPAGPDCAEGVKAVTAKCDMALIKVDRPRNEDALDVEQRAVAIAEGVQAEVLLISQTRSENEICFALPATVADRAAEALQLEFAKELAKGSIRRIYVERGVAIVTLVGQKMRVTSDYVERTFDALTRSGVNATAAGRQFSEANFSFVVPQKSAAIALAAAHREFRLDSRATLKLPARNS